MMSLKVKSLDSIGQYGALELRRVFPLSCSNDTLFDVFAEVCTLHGFLVTERTEDKASALKEFHNMFQCVVPVLSWPGQYASSRDIVINISIVSHEKHDYKLLSIIGPRRPATQQFFQAMEVGLSSMSHYWVSQFSNSVKRDFRVSFDNPHPPGSSMSVSETGNQTYKTEEAAYYYFYKILSNQSYSVGIELGAFIAEFLSHFSDEKTDTNESIDSDSLLPAWTPVESMNRVLGQIAKTVHQFDVNYLSMKNPTSSLADDLLPRLQPSVERFVFESVGSELWLHYTHGFHELDRCFLLKASAIRDAASDSLQSACGIRSVLQFSFEKPIFLLNDLQRSFDALTRPNNLLQQLLGILVSIKTSVLTGSKGTRELESMDDIAPIFLFVVLSSVSLKSPNSIYHFLLDFMNPDQRMESEGRVVALLEGATRLVMNEWKQETLLDITQ